jgi:molybdate transport system regulatory protein
MTLTIRSRFWVEQDGELVLSDWRVKLLETIDELGSLAAASTHLNVPYRVAWGKIKEIEARLGVALLESRTGGAAGGSTQLTEAGRATVARYHRFQQGLPELIKQRFEEEFGAD